MAKRLSGAARRRLKRQERLEEAQNPGFHQWYNTRWYKLGIACTLAAAIAGSAGLYIHKRYEAKRTAEEAAKEAADDARAEQLHHAHIAEVARAASHAPPERYDATPSLADLVENTQFHIVDADVIKSAEDSSSFHLFRVNVDRSIADKTANLHYTSMVLASVMPNNAAFHGLERELNEELRRFAEHIKPFSSQKAPHTVILVTEPDQIQHPNNPEGHVPLFLVNSFAEYDVFTGLLGGSKRVNAACGPYDYNGSVRIDIIFAPNKPIEARREDIFISPDFRREHEYRKSVLLNTTITEYLHALFFHEKAAKLVDELKAFNGPDGFDNEKVDGFRNNYALAEEGLIHAAALTYLAQFPEHKEFVQHALEIYSSGERHKYTSPFFAAVRNFRYKERVINVESQILVLLEMFRDQRLDYLLTKQGVNPDAVTNYLRDFAPTRATK